MAQRGASANDGRQTTDVDAGLETLDDESIDVRLVCTSALTARALRLSY
jgi:hypothetical protein